MKPLFKLIKLLSASEKRDLALLTVAMVVMAVFEVLGVGAVGPFISVAADPAVIETNAILSSVYEALAFESTRGFLVFLGVGFFALVVAANALTTFVMYWVFRWSHMRAYSLARRLLSQYLYQPYAYFLDHNTSELSKNILTEVGQAIGQALLPAMKMAARGSVALAILLFLVVSQPLVALTVFVVLGGSYTLIYWTIQNRLFRIGREKRDYNRGRFKAAGEAFGAIKDVRILGKEPVFEKEFGRSAKGFAWATAKQQILTMLPKYAVQAVALGLVVGFITVLIYTGQAFSAVIPLISIYAFAGLRMMPALEVVFKSAGQLRTSTAVVEALTHDLTSGLQTAERARSDAMELEKTQDRMPFSRTIELAGLHFSYPSSQAPVLEDINLTIEKNTTVAFVGPTGCGKTTLVDLILGLLEAEGEIRVDGTPVGGENTRLWQRNFGYVPQQIFLADDTITRNIAFGVEPARIDGEAVERAARIAHLHDFVVEELPAGYETHVGERGVRLSGGQMQRVGIARALYHNPDILVLDEATSSLDSMTEEAVMDAIHELMGEKTIIIIAHRLTTVQEADVVYLLEKGRIVGSGSYDELMANNERFRAMAKVGT